MTRPWLSRRFAHTCTVWRDSGTAQNAGGEVQASWAAAYTAQPLRFAQARERYADQAGGAVMVEETFALMNGTADVTAADRISTIVDADSNSVASGTYVVDRVVVRRDIGGRAHHTRVDLSRLVAS